jgi:hypothetical protein
MGADAPPVSEDYPSCYVLGFLKDFIRGSFMKEGAFALIDCLGFKGVWKKYENELDQLISQLGAIGKNTEPSVNAHIYPPEITVEDIPYDIKVRVLSDTVAISYTSISGVNVPKWQLVSMTNAIQHLMDKFIKELPHLPFRGCITYGQHIIEENFLVGPAVNEAAEYHEKAQGSFVWLLPSASADVDVFFESMCVAHQSGGYADVLRKRLDLICPKYPVPMKDGQHLTTRVISPIYQKQDAEIDELIELYSNAMSGGNIDVWIKREQTLKFLEHCKSLHRSAMEAEEAWQRSRVR